VIKVRAQALQKRYSRGRKRQADLVYAAAKVSNRLKRLRYSLVLADAETDVIDAHADAAVD